jgi:RimJ/RimL family protein N-acetyltransferase
MRFGSQPTLTGQGVRLRPFREADLEALWAMLNGEEGNRLTGTHTDFTPEAVESWYRSRGQHEDRLDLAIARLTDDECVGEVVLNDLDAANASCGFRIALTGPHVYGRGYGSEATRLILAHAFEDVGLHRVELEVYAFNERAIHVYRQAGFTVEGVRREALRWDGRYHDALLMSLLDHEWHDRHHVG